MEDRKTPHLQLPKPSPQNRLEDDCPRIMSALDKIDAHAQTTDERLSAVENSATALGDRATALEGRASTAETQQAAAGLALSAHAEALAGLNEHKADKTELAQAEARQAEALSAQATAQSAALASESAARVSALNAHDADAAAHAALIRRVVMGDLSPVIGVALVQAGNGSGLWCNCTADGHIITPPRRYFDFHPIFSALGDRVLVDGQMMQRHKKFYYKALTFTEGELAGKFARIISPEPLDGFAPWPSFMLNGAERDCWYCGTYSAVDTGGTPKTLGSLPGRAPFVNVDFPTMQSYCRNRNANGVTGFDMWNIWQAGEMQTLFLIEYACPDSQGLIGRGRVDTNAAANVDADDVARASWRGHVGLWGNVWEMVAGIKVHTDGHVHLWKTDGSQEYVDTGFVLPAYNGSSWQYPTSFKTGSGEGYDFGCLFIPEAQSGSLTEAVVPDGFWGRNGSAGNVMYLGGDWYVGSAAGLFCLVANYPASNAAAWLGCRLAKV